MLHNEAPGALFCTGNKKVQSIPLNLGLGSALVEVEGPTLHAIRRERPHGLSSRMHKHSTIDLYLRIALNCI